MQEGLYKHVTLEFMDGGMLWRKKCFERRRRDVAPTDQSAGAVINEFAVSSEFPSRQVTMSLGMSYIYILAHYQLM